MHFFAGIKKFCIQKDESRNITFVLEKDGTEVDKEYLKHLKTDTILMLLKQDEKWSKGKSCFNILMLHVLYVTKASIRKLPLHQAPNIIYFSHKK